MRQTVVVSTDPPMETEPDLNGPLDASDRVANHSCSSTALPVMPARDVTFVQSEPHVMYDTRHHDSHVFPPSDEPMTLLSNHCGLSY